MVATSADCWIDSPAHQTVRRSPRKRALDLTIPVELANPHADLTSSGEGN